MSGKMVPQPADQPEAWRVAADDARDRGAKYFRLGAPMRSNLLEPGDKPELVLSGRVSSTRRGRQSRTRIVDLWSSDAIGNYDMIGYRYNGYVVTDAEGRYEFTTIVPGCYEPRRRQAPPRHDPGISSPVVTQLYIEGEPGNEDERVLLSDVACEGQDIDENGTKHGTFDFVISQVTERENVTPESLAATV